MVVKQRVAIVAAGRLGAPRHRAVLWRNYGYGAPTVCCKRPMVVKQCVATMDAMRLGAPCHHPRILQQNRADNAHGLRPGLVPDTRAGGKPHLVVLRN